MATFIMEVLEVTIGMLMASAIMMFIITRKPVLKAYTKWVLNASNEIAKGLINGEDDDK